jgi:hypothetical protein
MLLFTFQWGLLGIWNWIQMMRYVRTWPKIALSVPLFTSKRPIAPRGLASLISSITWFISSCRSTFGLTAAALQSAIPYFVVGRTWESNAMASYLWKLDVLCRPNVNIYKCLYIIQPPPKNGNKKDDFKCCYLPFSSVATARGKRRT